MKSYQTLEIEFEDDICTVWLNRPEKHNAFNEQMLRDLIDCYTVLNESSSTCIILRGKGKSFCAGADLNWMKDTVKNNFSKNLDESLLLSECFYTLYTFKKPTIAIVHGSALGGANGLLAACDLAYCADNTVFSLSEVKIGIIPACISPYIIKRIGEYPSKELMLTGRRFNGTEAAKYSLVNQSVPFDKLDGTILPVIENLRTSGPNAMSQCKKLIYEVSNNLKLNEAYQYTAKMIAEIRNSDEAQEGMNAFLEKRKPKWIKI
jgi:methylglutaconyl-CoA hydratase